MTREKFESILHDHLESAKYFTDADFDKLYEGMNGEHTYEGVLMYFCRYYENEFLEVLGFEDEDEFIDERGGQSYV